MAVVMSPFSGTGLQVEQFGTRVYYSDNAGPPTSGAYVAGDMCICMPVAAGVAPTVLAPLGWRCTTGGASAVWTPLGMPQLKGANVASAASITPTGTVFGVTGNTQITTIVATNVAAGQVIYLLPTDASTFTTATGGNIALATTGVRFKILAMMWDGAAWNPSY